MTRTIRNARTRTTRITRKTRTTTLTAPGPASRERLLQRSLGYRQGCIRIWGARGVLIKLTTRGRYFSAARATPDPTGRSEWLAPVTVPVHVYAKFNVYRSPETRADSNNKHIFVIRFLRRSFAQGKYECKGEVDSWREATAKGKMEGRETTAVGGERACPVQCKSSAAHALEPTYLLLPCYLPKITQMSARV